MKEVYYVYCHWSVHLMWFIKFMSRISKYPKEDSQVISFAFGLHKLVWENQT